MENEAIWTKEVNHHDQYLMSIVRNETNKSVTLLFGKCFDNL